MTTTINPALILKEGVSPPPVRLTLKPAGADRGLLDGAWWPRSRDLARELPALTDVLDHRWARITRITVNPTYWPVIPRKIPVTGHVVHVGWFKAEQDPHKLLLLSYTEGRWDLLVIPPESSEPTAARLMAAAADPHNHCTASTLIADEKPPGVPEAGYGEEQARGVGGGTAPFTLGRPVTLPSPARPR
ncbi:DUF5994 family protein [Streptomyces klenkii]|uniref:DUF5994 family protein n=1 Tax=Streptomyces klenkii TaxID=1420899 RepID=UPI0034268CA1